LKIDRSEIKREARSSMRTQRPSVYLVALLLMLLLWVLEILSIKLMYPGENLLEIAEHYLATSEAQTVLTENTVTLGDFMEQYAALQDAASPPTGFGRLLDIAINLMTLMLNVGFLLFCLNVSRGAEASPGNLLDTFGIFFKVFWLSFLSGLFIMLWSMLLVIPGIIATYRYSQALFILLDDPDKGAMQCIRESGEMMRGRKWELFVLDLSFLGWLILSAIPFVAVYTLPYYQITKANFYRRVSGRMEAPAGPESAAEPDDRFGPEE